MKIYMVLDYEENEIHRDLTEDEVCRLAEHLMANPRVSFEVMYNKERWVTHEFVEDRDTKKWHRRQ